MVDRVSTPSPVTPVVEEDGTMAPFFTSYMQTITERAMIIGSGSPEGVIEAVKGALYMDEDAASGDVLYVKRLADISGDNTQGWRAV